MKMEKDGVGHLHQLLKNGVPGLTAKKCLVMEHLTTVVIIALMVETNIIVVNKI